MPDRVFVVGVGMTDFLKPSERPDCLQHNLGLGGAAVVTLYRQDGA